MNNDVKHNDGVDVSAYDTHASVLKQHSAHLYDSVPQFGRMVDSLKSQFSQMFNEEMLKFHSRSGTMCEPLYNYLVEMINDYPYPLCTALVHFVSKDKVESAELAMYFKLLLHPNYVIKQVGLKTFNKLRFSAQQALRLNSVKQVDAFVSAYQRYPSALTAEEQFAIIASALPSFKPNSGLPSGDLFQETRASN